MTTENQRQKSKKMKRIKKKQSEHTANAKQTSDKVEVKQASLSTTLVVQKLR